MDELSNDSDLIGGRFGEVARDKTTTAKRLLTFLDPELKETNMSRKDQEYMVNAMIEEGFDLASVILNHRNIILYLKASI